MLEQGEPFHVVDFDGTAADGYERMYNHPDFTHLQVHRGNSFFPVLQQQGTEGMLRFLGLFEPQILDRHVFGEVGPHPLILTAGIEAIQREKVERTGLARSDNLFVPEGMMKTKALIDYFKNRISLGVKMPREVHIWEDRPWQINRKALEIALETRVLLHEVKLAAFGGPTFSICS